MNRTHQLAVAAFVATFIAAGWIAGVGSFRALVWSLIAAYLPSYFDGTEYTAEGRYWPWFAQLDIFKRAMKWFPARIEYEVPLDPNKQYIFASHPHGAMSIHHGMYLLDSVGFHKYSPGATRREIGATAIFKIPLYRDFCLWAGAVDAGVATCRKILSRGWSMGVLVGGEQEQMIAQPGKHEIFIKKRKGFIRLALAYGVPIVPAYAFGETDLYYRSKFLYKLRFWVMQNLRVAIPIAWGDKWWIPLFPRQKPIVVMMGKPIEVTKSAGDPIEQEVTALHDKYIAEQQRIFEENKARLGFAGAELRVL